MHWKEDAFPDLGIFSGSITRSENKMDHSDKDISTGSKRTETASNAVSGKVLIDEEALATLVSPIK